MSAETACAPVDSNGEKLIVPAGTGWSSTVTAPSTVLTAADCLQPVTGRQTISASTNAAVLVQVEGIGGFFQPALGGMQGAGPAVGVFYTK
jgi:hypothetical protein